MTRKAVLELSGERAHTRNVTAEGDGISLADVHTDVGQSRKCKIKLAWGRGQ